MKKVKILGISIISLIWVFSLIIIISLSVLLFFTIEYKYFMSDIKTDTVELMNKRHHIMLHTIDGQKYDESTEYWFRFSNGDIHKFSIPGINNYKYGTEIEISYRKSDLTNSIELIDFNADTDSDLTVLDRAYEYPFWENIKSIEVEKVN